jgi:hypothetical protein
MLGSELESAHDVANHAGVAVVKEVAHASKAPNTYRGRALPRRDGMGPRATSAALRVEGW